MLRQRGVGMGRQLGGQGRVVLRADAAGAGAAGPWLGGQVVSLSQGHEALNGGQPNAEALGYLTRVPALVQDGPDNPLA